MNEPLTSKTHTLQDWVSATPEREQAFAEEGLITLVAEEIYALLEKQGLSKADLAEKLGCSKANVTGLLSGSRNMSCRTLAHIAHVLGHDVCVTLRSRTEPTDLGWKVHFDALSKVHDDVQTELEQWKQRAEAAEARLADEPETALDDHSELLKKLPNVHPDLVAELEKLSKWALVRRVLIQADWLGSYSKCLDGLDLRVGVDGCWNPRDIRAAVEKLRAAEPPSAWQPIETAPHDREVLFWVVPLSADETYRDTSGNPITSGEKPRMMFCRFGRWSSLSKAIYWADVPGSPTVTKSEEPEPEHVCDGGWACHFHDVKKAADEPDARCITTPDGGCVSSDCMHTDTPTNRAQARLDAARIVDAMSAAEARSALIDAITRASVPPAASRFNAGDRVEWTNRLKERCMGVIFEVHTKEPSYVVKVTEHMFVVLMESELRPAVTKDAPRLCPHGMPLEENICGPCSQGRPNRRADETSAPPIDLLAELKGRLDVPNGYFCLGRVDRFECRNCGRHYDEHTPTDGAPRCPTVSESAGE